jgi:hypothetical protein
MAAQAARRQLLPTVVIDGALGLSLPDQLYDHLHSTPRRRSQMDLDTTEHPSAGELRSAARNNIVEEDDLRDAVKRIEAGIA